MAKRHRLSRTRRQIKKKKTSLRWVKVGGGKKIVWPSLRAQHQRKKDKGRTPRAGIGAESLSKI